MLLVTGVVCENTALAFIGPFEVSVIGFGRGILLAYLFLAHRIDLGVTATSFPTLSL